MPTSAACCAAGEDVVVIDVLRSPLWSSDGREDVLKVEILRTSSVACLRKRIAELYSHSEVSQRLQRTPELGGTRLGDATPVADLVHQPVFLLPADVDIEEPHNGIDIDLERSSRGRRRRQRREEEMARAQAEAEEHEAFVKGLVESLQGVAYNVHIVFPEAYASITSSSSKTLALDAMVLIGDVQVMLEVEMMGCTGKIPMMLFFKGQPLPPNMPLHFAGVRDGDTLDMVINPGFPCQEMLPEEDSDDDDPVLNWVANN